MCVCQQPAAGTLVYKVFHEPDPHSDEEALLQGLGNIFNFLVSVNAACNFLLYCAFSDKYRRTFIRTFRPYIVCCRRPIDIAFYRLFINKESGRQEQPLQGDERNITLRFEEALMNSPSPAGEGCADIRPTRCILRPTPRVYHTDNLLFDADEANISLRHKLILQQRRTAGIGNVGPISYSLVEESPISHSSPGFSRYNSRKRRWRSELWRNPTNYQFGNRSNNNLFVLIPPDNWAQKASHQSE